MAGWKTQAEVAAIRKRYPAGSRIELDYMNEQGMPPGLKGIVKSLSMPSQLPAASPYFHSLQKFPAYNQAPADR